MPIKQKVANLSSLLLTYFTLLKKKKNPRAGWGQEREIDFGEFCHFIFRMAGVKYLINLTHNDLRFLCVNLRFGSRS